VRRHRVIEKSGAWFSHADERIGQGREAARRFLVENPDLRERIAEAVYAAKGIKRAVPARGGPEAAEAAAERE
jgi:recombination protein RecA